MLKMLNIKRFKDWNVDLLSLTAALCLATLPWGIRLNTYVILAFSIGLVGYTLSTKKTVKIDFRNFFIGSTLFFIILFWMLVTSNSEAGFKHIERSVSIAVFPILFSIIHNQYKLNIHYVLILFMLSCLIRYFFFLIEIVEYELIFIFDYWIEILLQFNQLFKEHALHPSYFSMFLGFCSMTCYFYLIYSKKTFYKAFWTFGLFLFLTLNLSLMSKMPIIASIISLSLVSGIDFVRNTKRKKRVLIGLIVPSLLLLVTLVLVKTPGAFSQDLNNYYRVFKGEKIEDIYDYDQFGLDSSLDTWEKTNRVHIWKSSMEIFKENPLVGVGTGDINDELNRRFMVNNQKYLAIQNTNTHNQFLDYLIKYGILGFALIAFSFVIFFKEAWKEPNGLFLMFLVLCIFCMITENILNRQLGIVFFFFLNSMFFFSGPSFLKFNQKELD